MKTTARARNEAVGIAVALALLATPALADQTNVAVAANFTDAANEIAAAFKAETGHEATLSFGSTGQHALDMSKQESP